MGVQLGDLIPRRRITLQDLSGKTIAIDAFNALYQFLSIIRGADGRPLMDGKGRVTSHLSGLLYRTTNLAELGVLPSYVFDGEPPKLKRLEIIRREEVKREATVKYEKALEEGRMDDVRTYAQATARLRDYMVLDSQHLLSLMGVPWVQAPSEGEAQAAHMAAKGDVYAAASQDYDSLLFGAPTLVRNITISGRRKLPRKNAYVEVEPEIVELKTVLHQLQIDRTKLIYFGMLVGTDYNPGGVKGIGPKTALKLVSQYGSFQEIREHLKDRGIFPVDSEELVKLFLEPKVRDRYDLLWTAPDVEGVVAFLCGERDFSEERVRKALEKMGHGLKKAEGRSTLEKWFG
ncbi:flap endonuclease-1 [Candidatus Bathyarchaeota archaeon]|nr:flap endonuclease-1 [Candidatus Bathyarchaeota archaeon]